MEPVEHAICDDDSNVPFVHSDQDSDTESFDENVFEPEYESNTHSDKKRKCVVVSQPTGLDRIYVDNQKLWRQLAKVSSQVDKLEEKLRYSALEANNRFIEISELKEDKKQMKSTLAEMKSSLFWARFQRNSITVAMLSMTIFNVFIR